jgi:hypothetical protein
MMRQRRYVIRRARPGSLGNEFGSKKSVKNKYKNKSDGPLTFFRAPAVAEFPY